MKTARYEPRTYRDSLAASGLRAFTVAHLETDLWIAVDAAAPSPALEEEATRIAAALRESLEKHIAADPQFLHSLIPHHPVGHCPSIAACMAAAAAKAGVGPMAAVAGAVSAFVGKHLEERFSLSEIIVENGGDIYLRTRQTRHIAIYAGSSPLSNKVALKLDPSRSPLGICTSSGTVGHSHSFGRADAATVVAADAAVADAYATALGNIVKSPADIEAALAFAAAQPDILGAVIITGDRIGAWGQIQLVPASQGCR